MSRSAAFPRDMQLEQEIIGKMFDPTGVSVVGDYGELNYVFRQFRLSRHSVSEIDQIPVANRGDSKAHIEILAKHFITITTLVSCILEDVYYIQIVARDQEIGIGVADKVLRRNQYVFNG